MQGNSRFSQPEMPEFEIEEQDEKPQKSWPREVLEWIRTFFIALLVVLIINQFLIVNARVPSRSMQDTINPEDRLIGLRTSYWFSEPQRGDIIIFRFPDNEKELYIKRIIGMPGEKVEIIDGMVYINGHPLGKEPYVQESFTGNYGPYYVPEGSYFVMGDNRDQSADSRYWDNTFVKREKIVGKAVVRIYPDPQWLG